MHPTRKVKRRENEKPAVFEHLPGRVRVEVDLDEVLIADGQQTVARDILLDIVVDGILVEAMALDEQLGVKTEFEHALLPPYSSSLSTARNASVGIWTVPSWRIFFLPSFCFSSSFFLRVMSPP